TAHNRLTTEFSFSADFAGHARDFSGEGVKLVHHDVDGVFEFENFAAHVDGDFAAQVAVSDGGRDFSDVADLRGKVTCHGVDRFALLVPLPIYAVHNRLTTEFSFSADFAGHAGDFSGEGVELVDHDVDGVLQFENFTAHVHGDFAAQVA